MDAIYEKVRNANTSNAVTSNSRILCDREWNGLRAMMLDMNEHLQFICFVAGIAGIILMFVLGDDD